MDKYVHCRAIRMAAYIRFVLPDSRQGSPRWSGSSLRQCSALIYPTLLKSGTQKRLRKLHQEILGNENSFVCEVELTPYGFTVSQMNREIKYSWQAVKEIEETSDSVDIFTRDGGGVIVRNRAFQSVAERMTFIESATSFLNQNRG